MRFGEPVRMGVLRYRLPMGNIKWYFDEGGIGNLKRLIDDP